MRPEQPSLPGQKTHGPRGEALLIRPSRPGQPISRSQPNMDVISGDPCQGMSSLDCAVSPEFMQLYYSTTDDNSTTSNYMSGSGESDEVDDLRKQIHSMELMYGDLLKSLGVKNETLDAVEKNGKGGKGEDKKVRRAQSIVLQSQRSRDIKAVNRRFSRLESHVVTLARSVAHLSSEMRSQNLMFQEVEHMKRQIDELRVSRLPGLAPSRHQELERFRQILPGLTNPYRITKLSKFFGEKPPLIQLFLKKLGYERYIPNFERENISMLELPYLDEHRLERMSIPMGPRLRILQEAQKAFQHENFPSQIYIV
ncbi:PREDICTED: uncharacterized protein LOC106816475 [Priapulus caudatus]|uniref:Uncharacterized protein LOC106816475 n=1 Tax=Priapulus caudatus TaxID=37621 RepID=A0ABM1EWL6_PRICU|nr:PREDICTED: uncharacterized protein LOC106816475 [Priapulus caudatus]